MKMARYSLLVMMMLFLTAVLGAQTSARSRQHSKIIVIDTRPMLLAHPLFSSFDPKTRRFIGTRSEPVVGEESRSFIKADIESHQLALAKYNEDWSERLKKATGKQRQTLEAQYLKGKKRHETKIGEIRQRYWATAAIPNVPGLTEPASVVTQTNQIARDIRDSILKLQKRTGASLVMDISSLMPSGPVPYRIEIVQTNQLAYLPAQPRYGPELLEWVREARNYWMNHGNLYNPFIIGTEDQRIEAVEELIRHCQGEN